MTFKITLAAIALAVVPTLSVAMGCSGGHEEASISCADGTTWDDAVQKCVASTS